MTDSLRLCTPNSYSSELECHYLPKAIGCFLLLGGTMFLQKGKKDPIVSRLRVIQAGVFKLIQAHLRRNISTLRTKFIFYKSFTSTSFKYQIDDQEDEDEEDYDRGSDNDSDGGRPSSSEGSDKDDDEGEEDEDDEDGERNITTEELGSKAEGVAEEL